MRFSFLFEQLEKKIRQAEESLKKSDKDYLNACQKAESARQEWEGAVYKVSGSRSRL